MIRKLILASLLGLNCLAADYDIRIDAQSTIGSDAIVYEGDYGTLGLKITDGREPKDVSGVIKFWYGTNGLQSDAVASVSLTTTATNYVAIPFISSLFPTNSPRNGWLYGVTDDGKILADGRLYIKDRPGVTGGELQLTTLTNVDWTAFNQYLNTLTHGPYRAGDGVTSITNSDGSISFNVTVASDFVSQSEYDLFVAGLGTAATNPATAFATAAQGLLADSALQPGDSNTNLVNDAGYLTSETDPVASTNLAAHIDDTTAAHVASAISVTGTAATVQAQLTELDEGKLSTAGGTVAGTLGVYGFRWDHTYEGGDGNYHILQPWAAIGGNNGYGTAFRYTWGVNEGYIPFDAPSSSGRFHARNRYSGNWVMLSVGCTNLGALATQDVVAASSVTVTNTEGNVQAKLTALDAADTSADRTPYIITYASTVTVSRANTDLQQLEPITGACTIVFPSGVTNYASCIELVIPPVGTQTVALATGPTYYYGDSLTGPSTTNYTHALWQSVYGATGATVRLYRGPQ